MRMVDVPMPAAVAARPRDERGYPVPAITPWVNGVPRFASTGTARTYICAVERRCSVCGLPMGDGRVWRVVGGAEADAIDDARGAGTEYRNAAATVEAPGHRTCMLYAAVVCPYLAEPTARRGQGAQAAGLTSVRGDRRGLGGALAGFDAYEFRYTDTVLFRFSGLAEFRRHERGEEQFDALVDAVSVGTGTAGSGSAGSAAGSAAPGYLLADETAADRRFAEHLAGRLST